MHDPSDVPTTPACRLGAARARSRERPPYARPSAPKLELRDSWRRQPLSELGRSLEPLFEPMDRDLRAAVEPIHEEEGCPPTVRASRSSQPSEPAATHAVVSVDEPSSLVLSVRGSAPRSQPRTLDCVPSAGLDGQGEMGVMPVSSRLEEEFFRFDSFPPVVEQLDEPEPAEPESEPVPSAVLVRRRRLRTGVGATVVATAALMVAALVYGMLLPSRGLPAAFAQPAKARPEAGGTLGAGRSAPTLPPRPSAAERPFGGTSSGLSTSAPGSGSAEASPVSGTARELRQAAVELLARRQPARAAERARALIAAEPEDAFGYLCLGSALQDQGKWGEAHQAYAQCVHQAKRGDVAECGALGGRR